MNKKTENDFRRLLENQTCPVCGMQLALVRPNITLDGFTLASTFVDGLKEDRIIRAQIVPGGKDRDFFEHIAEHYQSYYCLGCNLFFHTKTKNRINPFDILNGIREHEEENDG